MDKKTWKSSTVVERLKKLRTELHDGAVCTTSSTSTAILVRKAYNEYKEKWGD